MSKASDLAYMVGEVLNEDNDPKYRLEQWLNANELRKSMKTGWSKIAATGGRDMDLLGEQLKICVAEIILEEEQEDMNAEKAIRALFNKTTKNGCTLEEETSAYTKAMELAEKYGETSLIKIFASKDVLKRLFPDPEPVSEPKPSRSKAKATETTGDTKKPERGAIGAYCQDLILGTLLSYDEIALMVRAKFPTARTTARSLASVAKDLRAAGIDVPNRRVKKKTP